MASTRSAVAAAFASMAWSRHCNAPSRSERASPPCATIRPRNPCMAVANVHGCGQLRFEPRGEARDDIVLGGAVWEQLVRRSGARRGGGCAALAAPAAWATAAFPITKHRTNATPHNVQATAVVSAKSSQAQCVGELSTS